MTWTKWTPEQELFVLGNYRSMSATKIGEIVGFSAHAVIGKANRLGLATPRGERSASDYAAERARKRIEGRAKAREAREAAKPKPGPRAQMLRRQVAKIVCQMQAPMGKRGDAQEIADRVAARKAPPRTCSWRDRGKAGLSRPCCSPAVPGQMWCDSHLESVRAIKETA